MPRGEENQVPPQEGEQASREVKSQDEVKEQEAQRDQAVVEDPAAVVELERPVKESEAIEAAIVEAVEAVAEVGTPEQASVDHTVPEREEDPTAEVRVDLTLPEAGKEGSASDLKHQAEAPTLETPGEELERKRPGKEDGAGDAIQDVVAEPQAAVEEAIPDLMETAKKAPEQVGIEMQEAAADEGQPRGTDDQIMQSEEEEPEEEEEEQALVAEQVMDEEEPQSIRSSDQIMGSEEEEEEQAVVADQIMDEEEPQSISTPDQIMGSEEGTAQDEHEDHWSAEAAGDQIMDQEEEEQGGSILIGEEGEGDLELGEGLDGELSPETVLNGESPEGKDVDEYWEPPKMYLYTNPDGTTIIVDSKGNTIKNPPQNMVPIGEAGPPYQAWYDGDANPQAFEITTWPGYQFPKYYLKEKLDGEKYLVDQDGNPVSDGHLGIQVKQDYQSITYKEPNGDWIEPIRYEMRQPNYLLYTQADGTKTFVHSDGTPMKCPPKLEGTPQGDYGFRDEHGKFIKVDEYQQKLDNVYLYQAQDGTKTLVDAYGNPLKNPPQNLIFEPETDTILAWYNGQKKPEGSNISTWKGYGADEFYIKKNAQGDLICVDSNGSEIKEQPTLYSLNLRDDSSFYSDGKGNNIPAGDLGHAPDYWDYANQTDRFYYQDPAGNWKEIIQYDPVKFSLKLYTAEDGSKTLVHSDGSTVKCPPTLWEGNIDEYGFKDSDGKFIKIESYSPPTDNIFIHTADDGTKTVVDENGNPVKYPPKLALDPSDKDSEVPELAGVVGPDNKFIKLQEYQPPLEDIFFYRAKDGTITVVDENGNPLKIPPKLSYHPEDASDDGVYAIGPDGKKVLIGHYKPISSHWKKGG